MRKRVFFAGTLATLAAPALAQFGGGRRRGGTPGAPPAGGEGKAEPPAPALEVTMHELHEDLKLTAEQEPPWQRYEDGLRALGNDVARERGQRPSASASLVQRIDHVVDVARDRLTALEDIGQAAKTLYAKLAPDQQKVADPRVANLMALTLGGQQGASRPRKS